MLLLRRLPLSAVGSYAPMSQDALETLSHPKAVWFLSSCVSGCPTTGCPLPSELYGFWASKSQDILLSEQKHTIYLASLG